MSKTIQYISEESIEIADELYIAFRHLCMNGHFVKWRQEKYFKEIVPYIIQINMDKKGESNG